MYRDHRKAFRPRRWIGHRKLEKGGFDADESPTVREPVDFSPIGPASDAGDVGSDNWVIRRKDPDVEMAEQEAEAAAVAAGG